LAGSKAFLQMVQAATAGAYTITVSGGASSGQFTLQATLNAALEAESYAGTPNNSRITAESLDAAAESLGGGGSRMAVMGTTKSNSVVVATEDFEAGVLPAALT